MAASAMITHISTTDSYFGTVVEWETTNLGRRRKGDGHQSWAVFS